MYIFPVERRNKIAAEFGKYLVGMVIVYMLHVFNFLN